MLLSKMHTPTCVCTSGNYLKFDGSSVAQGQARSNNVRLLGSQACILSNCSVSFKRRQLKGTAPFLLPAFLSMYLLGHCFCHQLDSISVHLRDIIALTATFCGRHCGCPSISADEVWVEASMEIANSYPLFPAWAVDGERTDEALEADSKFQEAISWFHLCLCLRCDLDINGSHC